MENFKQIMKNVDDYMLKLIEAIETIEPGEFSHPEGQFSKDTLLCYRLYIVKRTKLYQGQSWINNRMETVFSSTSQWKLALLSDSICMLINGSSPCRGLLT